MKKNPNHREGFITRDLSIMVKPASSLCNLRCRYCFYADVSEKRAQQSCGIMTEETIDRLLTQVFTALEPGDRLHFAFQGGEPSVAGIDRIRCFMEEAEKRKGKVSVSWAFQTNGTLVDEDWCRLFRDHHVLVGLSFDLPEDCHDRDRVDAEGHGTADRVRNTIRLFRTQQVEFNVLSTLTSSAAKHPRQVWNSILKHRLQYVQFTPCLSPLDRGKDPWGLTPELFASFYTALFDDWFAEFHRGHYISIKLFDDLINRIAFGWVGMCGLDGRCLPQLVVEANGDTYPCDFYCLDEAKLGNLTTDSLESLWQASKNSPFKQQDEKRLCAGCSYAALCGGGCRRMRANVCYGPGDTFCGMKRFLDARAAQLQAIAMQQRQR